jgi:hypothetical protein
MLSLLAPGRESLLVEVAAKRGVLDTKRGLSYPKRKFHGTPLWTLVHCENNRSPMELLRADKW